MYVNEHMKKLSLHPVMGRRYEESFVVVKLFYAILSFVFSKDKIGLDSKLFFQCKLLSIHYLVNAHALN